MTSEVLPLHTPGHLTIVTLEASGAQAVELPAGGVEGRAPAVAFAAQVRSNLYSVTPHIEHMGWPHCFKMHQGRADTRQAPQPEQQDTPSEVLQKPSLAHIRPEPSERDKQSAEALKKEGNTYFVLLVNRALCQKKKEAWSLVQQDAEAALAIDSHLLKAHYLLGMALRHAEQLLSSVQHLKQALDLAREGNDNIKDEIWHELAQVQYMRWQQESAEQLQSQQQLQERMQQVLQLQHCQEAAAQGAPPNVQQDQMLEHEALGQVFQAAEQGLTAGEPASAFTCPLTMEVFRDPVMSPSGLSYERSALLEHLSKVGGFDPITRKAMTVDQMVPNVALRNATLQYLDEHPWAWVECC